MYLIIHSFFSTNKWLFSLILQDSMRYMPNLFPLIYFCFIVPSFINSLINSFITIYSFSLLFILVLVLQCMHPTSLISVTSATCSSSTGATCSQLVNFILIIFYHYDILFLSTQYLVYFQVEMITTILCLISWKYPNCFFNSLHYEVFLTTFINIIQASKDLQLAILFPWTMLNGRTTSFK